MIKTVGPVIIEDYGKPRKVRVELVADTSIEVEDIGNKGKTVEGLGDDDIMVMGSTCVTTDFEVGMLDSTGNWKF